MDQTTILKVLDGRIVSEKTLDTPAPVALNEALVPYPRNRRGQMTVNPDEALTEAVTGQLTVANFPDLLRNGVQFDVFSGYNETPVIYPQLCQVLNSNKQQEEYLMDAGIGIAPVVNEGQEYPEAAANLNDGVIIRNYKRGYKMTITEEMQMFDQLGKVRDLAANIGRSLRMTEEYAFMDILTTTGNYARTTAAGDNDEGNNTSTNGFSATNFVTAWNVLTTMKDRKSGMYLGVRPNTLVVAPKLLWAARAFFGAPDAYRTGAQAANEVYGLPAFNAFYGSIDMIVSSPYVGASYQWGLMERGRAIVFQRLMAPQVTGPYRDETNDTLYYKAKTYFGVGMKDDRFAYYANSTTAPAGA